MRCLSAAGREFFFVFGGAEPCGSRDVRATAFLFFSEKQFEIESVHAFKRPTVAVGGSQLLVVPEHC